MNVFVRPGSKAELACRSYAAGQKVRPKERPPHADVIAPGFRPRPGLNLHDQGGKIIRDLVYTNCFVGGNAWDPNDVQRINQNLKNAMTDQNLNNVLIQYFRGAANITTIFVPTSVKLPDKPSTISQPEVENLLKSLHEGGKLTEFKATARIDTPIEVEYFRCGGILSYVLLQLLGASEKVAA